MSRARDPDGSPRPLWNPGLDGQWTFPVRTRGGRPSMRVLIVDDEPNIRRTLRIALEAMGHAVEEASTRAEALRQAEGRPFDVALVDLRLGTEDGLDLLEPLLLQSPRLAIV